MKHLEIAYTQDGVTEVAGARASDNVLMYFKQTGL